MIDAGEVAFDVSVDDINAVTPAAPWRGAGSPRSGDGGVRPLASATGVAVGDEVALEERLHHPHQGVVHDAVGEGRRGDVAALGVLDREDARTARLPRSPDEMLMNVDEPLFPVR